MTCEQSLRLLASAIDGQVPPKLLKPLIEHLETCGTCWLDAEWQMKVKRVLASRPAEPLPPGFARRIAERLDREERSARESIVDWRRLTLRLLPVAAGLAAMAVVVHRGESRSPDDLAAAIVAFGQEEVRRAHAPPIGRDTTDRQTIGFLLLAPSTEQPTEGPR
jgi:Putative zinc-finger